MSRVFAPSLAGLVAAASQRPLSELWGDPAEVARLTADLAGRTGATHVLFPFDAVVLAESSGAEVDWTDDDVSIRPGVSVDLAEIEPEAAATGGRYPEVVEATRFLARLRGVAAHVPSPSLLVSQTGAPSGDREQVASADDLCTTYARALLEAGAGLLIVETTNDEDAAEIAPLRRLGTLFGVDCHAVGADVQDVLVLSPDDLTDPDRAAGRASRAQVVLTDRPLPRDVDLSAVLRLATSLSEEGAC